jgi:hypothetical protein
LLPSVSVTIFAIVPGILSGDAAWAAALGNDSDAGAFAAGFFAETFFLCDVLATDFLAGVFFVTSLQSDLRASPSSPSFSPTRSSLGSFV